MAEAAIMIKREVLWFRESVKRLTEISGRCILSFVFIYFICVAIDKQSPHAVHILRVCTCSCKQSTDGQNYIFTSV